MKNAIERFEKKNMAAFQTLAFVAEQKKQLEVQEKEIKRTTESVAIDTKKWRAADPESYHEIERQYNKRTKKSEYIRITVK